MFNNRHSLVIRTFINILIKKYNILFILLVIDILELKKTLYKKAIAFINYLRKSIKLA